MARIYTRNGDTGNTRLPGGEQVSKDHVRLRVSGSLDELMAHIGVVRALNAHPEIERLLEHVQVHLFELGTDLSNPVVSESRIKADDVTHLEREIDRLAESCPALRAFILPGGTSVAAHLHVSRAVCRRAERDIVALAAVSDIPKTAIPYINRLSDVLFTLARFGNAEAGVSDTEWKPRS